MRSLNPIFFVKKRYFFSLPVFLTGERHAGLPSSRAPRARRVPVLPSTQTWALAFEFLTSKVLASKYKGFFSDWNGCF